MFGIGRHILSNHLQRKKTRFLLNWGRKASVSADQKTLIVNELFGNKISKFDIKEDGTLGEKRDFANFGELGDEPNLGVRIENASILPDGLALDSEGAVWIADTLNQRAVRIQEGGEVLEVVDTAPDGIFAVALGGQDGKTLFTVFVNIVVTI